jgi:DDE superfamily endonuclease
MEDVLDLYAEPYDPKRPQVCFDELPCQLVAETRLPLPAKPGQPVRYDYEYQRNGTCSLFGLFQPHCGWRHLDIRERRTAVDFAQQMKALVDEHFPEAEVIRVVLDNLNTHTPASLYAAFAPAEAHRIARKLEFHYTPKHGSWLNMIEIELSVLARQCLDQRVPDIATLQATIEPWERERNDRHATVNWRFTVPAARTKLVRLYPQNHDG